jgi:hypothetical protein
MIQLSQCLRDVIVKARNDAARSTSILDAYKVAEEVQLALPEENVALEDIISALVIHGGCFEAIEFNPRTMLEIVFPVSAGNGEYLEQNARSAA